MLKFKRYNVLEVEPPLYHPKFPASARNFSASPTRRQHRVTSQSPKIQTMGEAGGICTETEFPYKNSSKGQNVKIGHNSGNTDGYVKKTESGREKGKHSELDCSTEHEAARGGKNPECEDSEFGCSSWAGGREPDWELGNSRSTGREPGVAKLGRKDSEFGNSIWREQLELSSGKERLEHWDSELGYWSQGPGGFPALQLNAQ
ncbi:hypothetical protein C8J57DRAFT_1217657 [Mycena rebaudengoi]|nr:hypothetical protein C8J57DRAFT_1217657 [Mycena rebaudengoi]